MSTIAILYATREGHTRRIAEQTADKLKTRGHKTRLYDLTYGDLPPNLGMFDGAILAASIHLGRHGREVIEFVKQHRDELDAIPTAFISVSLTAATLGDDEATIADRAEAELQVQDSLERFREETGWDPKRVQPVAGALKFSEYGVFKRFVMKRIAESHGQAHDTSKDYEFTDWEALDTFVNDFLTHNVGPGRRHDREAPAPAESRYQRILVATDYSDRAEHAIDSAAALARRWGAFLDVVHVAPMVGYAWALPDDAEQQQSQYIKESLRDLDQLRERKLDGIKSRSHVLDDSSVASAIADLAKKLGSDLVVVATHGRSALNRMMLGSVAERVVRHAPCDVLVVHDTAFDATKHVAVATDFSAQADIAVDVGAMFAQALKAELTLLHVVDDNAASAVSSAPALGLKRRAWEELVAIRGERLHPSISVVTEVLLDKVPARAITEYCGRAEVGLVILGTHGRTGLARMLIGSVAERAVRQAPCAALVVR